VRRVRGEQAVIGVTKARHPATPLVWVCWMVGALGVPGGWYVGANGNGFGAFAVLGLGGLALACGRYLQHQIVAVPLVSKAIQHLMRGNLEESTAVLDSIPARAARSGTVRRAIATLRSMLALYEGRLEESVRYATSAIEGRRGIISGMFEGAQIAAAQSVRGLARAALNDGPGAKADADAAETSVHATADVIARARLVRAILASRAAYHEEAFRTYLTANARLVLEHAMPRERALFRALRRMSRSPARSVYREHGRVKDDQAPSKLASWIAYVAPDAADFVAGDRMLADRVDEEPIPSGVPSDMRALRTARAGAKPVRTQRRGTRLLAMWATLVVLFVGLWHFLTPAASTGAATPVPAVEAPIGPSSWTYDVVTTLFAAGIAALVFFLWTSLRMRRMRALALAGRLVAIGERARAKPALAALTTSGDGLIAATAGLELARLAAMEADFAEAISRCDAAIVRVSKQPLRASAADVLLPALMTESAVAMAARGGLEDADAELAVLCRDFPTYAALGSSLMRVRLLRAVRAGDRDAACAIARSRTVELLVPYREDVLADLLLAARGDVSDEDVARLDAELRDDAELRSWLDAVAPGLRDSLPLHGRRARVWVQAQGAAGESDLQPGESVEDGATIKRIEANG
jgi:hypothetical protein